MRRPPVHDESGISLVEMMVTTLLLGIVMAFVYQMLFVAMRQQTSQTERLENLDEARTLMALVTKDIRTAARLTATSSPFLEGDDAEVAFYGNVNNATAPNRVHIYVDSNDRLVEEVVVPSGTAPTYDYSGPPSVRTVGRYVDDGQPLFTYLDANGAALPTPLSADDLLDVVSVEVRLAVRKGQVESLPATVVENRVRLPNVDYNPIVQGGA